MYAYTWASHCASLLSYLVVFTCAADVTPLAGRDTPDRQECRRAVEAALPPSPIQPGCMSLGRRRSSGGGKDSIHKVLVCIMGVHPWEVSLMELSSCQTSFNSRR